MRFDERGVFERFPYRGSGIFIDVGANRGHFVAGFADRGVLVLAFEPHPEMHGKLLERFAGCGNVEVVRKAVADQPGELTFYASEEHPGIHSLAAFHPTHRPIGTVDVTTLDRELRDRGIADVRALKIDVEGADFLVLQGFDFERFRPELVMVEFMDERSRKHFGYTHHDMAAYMSGFGYSSWVSEWTPLVEYAGAEGAGESGPEWLGLRRYDSARRPAHGNLFFVSPADVRSLRRAALATALSESGAPFVEATRSKLRAVPGLRRAVRAVRGRSPRHRGLRR